MKDYTFIGILLTIHLILTYRAQVLINKSDTFNSFQKKFNSALNWILPFFWSFLIRNVLKEPKNKVMTKSNRKNGSKGNTSSWQSLTGHGG